MDITPTDYTHSINSEIQHNYFMHTYMCVQCYQTMFAYLNNSFLYISAVPQDSCTFIKTYTTLKQLLLSTKGISLALNTDSKVKFQRSKT